jgi:hypothetical protein
VSGKKIEEVLLDEDLSPLERLRLMNTGAYNKKIAEDLDKSPVSDLVGPDQRFLMKRASPSARTRTRPQTNGGRL